MNRTIPILLCGLLIALVATPVLPADETDDLFFIFFTGLVKRHEKLKTITMPDIEIHTVPDVGDDPVYLVTFEKPEDTIIFSAALEEDDILYGAIPKYDRQLILFSTHMLLFILTYCLD